MPDGPLCAACGSEALRHRGRCDACGSERLLPGVDGNGGRLCCSCVGITAECTCARCGPEWALRRGPCEWCHLGDVVDRLMDGDVDLSCLRAHLLRAARPDSLIIWLYQSHVQELLHVLSTGAIALSRPGLDGFGHRQAADHMRGLLVSVGLLPMRPSRRWKCSRSRPARGQLKASSKPAAGGVGVQPWRVV